MEFGKVILKTMLKMQTEGGLDMVPKFDLLETIKEQTEQEITLLEKNGFIYRPRHGFLKLTNLDV